MITWLYSNDEGISLEEKKQAKEALLDKLGVFKNEFEEKGAFVTINFSHPKEDANYFTFTFTPPYHHSEFIERFNEWQRAGRPE